MDQEIEIALAAKSTTKTLKLRPTKNTPWSKLHIDFTCPINGSYDRVVADNLLRGLKFVSVINKLPRLHCIFARTVFKI